MADTRPTGIHKKPVASGLFNGSSHEKVAKLLINNGDLPEAQEKMNYRHIAAVHSQARTSCLSHDSATSPSFLGFRNLMVLVLSSSPFCSGEVETRLTR